MGKNKQNKSAGGERAGLLAGVWRSIVGGPLRPRDDPQRRWLVLNLLLLHLRPVHVPEKTLRYRHTWGLGGSSLVLIILLMATGCLLMFVYEPSPEHAYASVLSLDREVPFGPLVRGMHYVSANLLVVVAGLHLLRVFFTGGFVPPRQFNWIIGLAALAAVLVASFTGYLLPWDQLSYWAITISSGMLTYVPVIGEALVELVRGGAEIGSDTLILFYTVHTTVIPVILIVLLSFHFWRVRKAGGVVVPRTSGEPVEEHPAKVLFLPNLFVREVAQACAVVAVVMILALVVEVPLAAAANPGMSPNPAKAPWYFAGFQELLLHLPPVLAVVVLPVLGALCVVMIPYLGHDRDGAGVWFRSPMGRRTAGLAASAALVVTPVWIVVDELVGGWVPSVAVAVVLLGLAAVLRQRAGVRGDELVQALLVGMLVAFLCLTLTCAWCRGPGMALTWPWSGQ